MRPHEIVLFLFLCLSLFNSSASGQDSQKPEINVIYGEKHIFTIETPENWVNDRDYAQKIGLVCFFYPKDEKARKQKNYFFANGIDKESSNETLDSFIKDDLKNFRQKYPDFKFDKIRVAFTGGLKDGVLYSFSNLTDRYKEEVLYGKTEDTFLIFSFAAMTKEDYEKYQPVFDRFIASFNYRGNNPKPFLEYMNSRK